MNESPENNIIWACFWLELKEFDYFEEQARLASGKSELEWDWSRTRAHHMACLNAAFALGASGNYHVSRYARWTRDMLKSKVFGRNEYYAYRSEIARQVQLLEKDGVDAD